MITFLNLLFIKFILKRTSLLPRYNPCFGLSLRVLYTISQICKPCLYRRCLSRFSIWVSRFVSICWASIPSGPCSLEDTSSDFVRYSWLLYFCWVSINEMVWSILNVGTYAFKSFSMSEVWIFYKLIALSFVRYKPTFAWLLCFLGFDLFELVFLWLFLFSLKTLMISSSDRVSRFSHSNALLRLSIRYLVWFSRLIISLERFYEIGAFASEVALGRHLVVAGYPIFE